MPLSNSRSGTDLATILAVRPPVLLFCVLLFFLAGRTVLRVNGGIWIGQKGYTLAVLVPDGTVTDVVNFNTSWFERDSSAASCRIGQSAPTEFMVSDIHVY